MDRFPTKQKDDQNTRFSPEQLAQLEGKLPADRLKLLARASQLQRAKGTVVYATLAHEFASPEGTVKSRLSRVRAQANRLLGLGQKAEAA